METAALESTPPIARVTRAQRISSRYWSARMRLRHLRKRIQGKLYSWRYVACSLVGYTRNLLARKTLQLDFGPAMRSLPDGSYLADEKTIARSQGIQNLRATYSGWVGVVEAEIFLMGFEAGVQWQSHIDTPL